MPRDRVVVPERAVDFDGLELRLRPVAEAEVQLAARLEQLLFRFRDDEPRGGHTFQRRQAGDVVVMSLGRGQDRRSMIGLSTNPPALTRALE